MWRALRNDLSEFVATVTEDTAAVLNQIDENFDKDAPVLSDEEEESLRRMKLLETYSTPLLRAKGEAEAEDEPLKTRVKEFLESFSAEAKTEEIAQLLESHPDTVKVYFEKLVPAEVSYDEFWQRHFFRCDPQRIAQEWEENEEEDEGEENEDEDEQQGPMTTFSSLIGGAVKAVSASLAEDDEGKQIQPGEPKTFFQGTRPPFVMNTAVDESEDEEEELGWDDEEEEEDHDHHQIEFKDEATERLQEQLKQALEERDLLQQTVHMQTKELAALRGGQDLHTSDDVAHLKMELFEKESELAAFKAKLMDPSRSFDNEEGVDRKGGSETEVARLVEELSVKDKELVDLQKVLKETQTKLEEVEFEKAGVQASLVGLQSTIGTPSELETKVRQLSETVQKLTTEKDSIQRSFDAAKVEFDATLAKLNKDLVAALEKTSRLESELEEALSAADLAKRRAAELEKETRTKPPAKVELTLKLDEADASQINASPDTTSTGVKVEGPADKKRPGSGEEEEDWGDDWGEED